MIKVEIIDIDNEFNHIEKYDTLPDFINTLGEMGAEVQAKSYISWDAENGEGMFFVEDCEGVPLAMGLIEEKRNREKTTIDDVLNAIN